MHPDLNAAAIAAHCRGTAAETIAIEVVDETGSTNADLLARIGSAGAPATAALAPAASGLPAAASAGAGTALGPMLLAARRQSAGRGRAGRSWQSDAGSLTFSLAWRFARPLAGLVGLPLAVGVALADVLRTRGAEVGLKWPNDVLLDGRKLAGILIETAGTAGPACAGQTWAVIGVGINLAPQAGTATSGTSASLLQSAPVALTATASQAPAAALPIAMLPATDRNRLLAELLDAMAICLQRFDAAGFAPWSARWNALHAYRDQEVRIVDRDRELHAGRALGVDDCGRLLLQTAAGMVAVMVGDVSLRPVLPAERR